MFARAPPFIEEVLSSPSLLSHQVTYVGPIEGGTRSAGRYRSYRCPKLVIQRHVRRQTERDSLPGSQILLWTSNDELERPSAE